ncbi:DUF3892 domain-containing protein [Clavibacter michiganensis]|uniref:DUF3892 domain-containing protein n=1 Tax=Clavibacter michiganensis TaxID=28447 RepID=UPI001D0BAD81|nr:DUF3892 domain-containing protein [Clavibacter michiganensis]UDM20526.1 DUF3892 domain-containing protein [Clavibacter michiganensis subsp. michiganensis]
MADRAVRQAGKDRDGDITSLADRGSSWSPVSKAQAIYDIENRLHTYHVPWKTAGRTEIRVVPDPKGKYLRTDSDNTTRNNLRDLPDA